MNSYESKIIRHRGLREDQEFPNSFEALQEQYKTAIETDIFLLKDGNLAVIHHKDYGLTQEEVENMNLADLEKLKTSSRGMEKSGSAIPLFREYIFNSYDRGIELAIDVKGSSPEMAQKTALAIINEINLMRQAGVFKKIPNYPEESISMHSLSIEALEKIKQELEKIGEKFNLGLFWASTPERAKDIPMSETAIEKTNFLDKKYSDWTGSGIMMAKKLDCKSVNLHATIITPEIIQRAHNEELKVYAWGVTDREKVEKLLAQGVDKIIYDPPKTETDK